MADGSYSPYARAIQVAYPPQQSVVQQPTAKPSLWESYRAVLAPTPEPTSHLQSAVTGLRHNLEGAAVGAILGAIYGKLGTLDFKGKYPIDGILGALLLALSVKEVGKPDGFSGDLRALSQSCMTVMAFRKCADWTAPGSKAAAGSEKKDSPPKGLPHSMTSHNSEVSVSGEDPILAFGRKHGFYKDM